MNTYLNRYDRFIIEMLISRTFCKKKLHKKHYTCSFVSNSPSPKCQNYRNQLSWFFFDIFKKVDFTKYFLLN